jgi:hypothetical protein
LKGKDYLQVAHRLVWFREEHPDWSIQTEFLQITETHSIAKATIRNEKGDIMSNSHKREDAKHFPDYIEKSETGAIGRSLALCGYGTQFEPELDEGERLADAPVIRPNSHAPKNMQPSDDEAGLGFQTGGVYIVPYGSHKGRTISKMAELIGKDKLEDTIIKHEQRVKENNPYAGCTIDQMLMFINEATDYIVKYENQADFT